MFLDALAVLSLTGIAVTTLAMGAFSVGMPLLLVVGVLGGGRPADAAALPVRPGAREHGQASRSAA